MREKSIFKKRLLNLAFYKQNNKSVRRILELKDIRFVTLVGSDSTELESAFANAGGSLSVCDLQEPPARRSTRELADFANRVLTGDIDTVVFVTGAGTRAIIESALQTVPRQRFLDGIADITTVAGSDAAAGSLQHYNIQPTVKVADGPADLDDIANWRRILMAVDHQGSSVNQNIALEKNIDQSSLLSGLESRGARLTSLAPFANRVPTDPAAAIKLFERIDAGDFHGVIFNDAASTSRFIFLAKRFGRVRLTKHLLDDHLVVCRDADSAEVLRRSRICDRLCPQGRCPRRSGGRNRRQSCSYSTTKTTNTNQYVRSSN